MRLRRRLLSCRYLPTHTGAYMNPSERDWEPKTSEPEQCCSGFLLYQLTLVMVHPQRGQSEPVPEKQVVPQLEQVLAVLHAQFLLPATHPQL